MKQFLKTNNFYRKNIKSLTHGNTRAKSRDRNAFELLREKMPTIALMRREKSYIL